MEKQLVEGRLSMTAKGYGFVIPDRRETGEDTDIFIRASCLGTAMHGDRVAARTAPPEIPGRSREGEIVEVLERANRRVVGTFERGRGIGFVTPDDTRLGQDILVQKSAFHGARTGSKVVAEITRWPTGRHGPAGQVVEVLGPSGAPGVDILSIMRSYGLAEEFPEAARRAAAGLPQEMRPEDLAGRRDRRELPVVTVDGEDAKDLDDGVFARKEPGGGFFLGVYIADVSWYVREGSALDMEARERGTSVYLVDRVVPMLPRELSNGICSLNEGEDRLAMACEMRLDATGRVRGYELQPAVIHVHRRLTYRMVNRALVERDPAIREDQADILPMLETLAEIRQLRKALRERRGAIDFDAPEIKVKLDWAGHPVAIQRREGSLAESVIEECMLAANETVAEHMERRQLPSLYRVHEQPAAEKLESLNRLLASFGMRILLRDGTARPMDVQRVVEAAKGRPEERLVGMAALRSMQQARYSAESLGHFGLAARYYTHFTSPIRRYPDLVVHRLLRETLGTGTMPAARRERLRALLPEIAEHASRQERRAIEAERETTDLKKIEYMAGFVGETYPGIISGVTAFGIFVELPNGVEGLVHVSSLRDDYYSYVEDQCALVGSATGKVYRLGDETEVTLLRANVQERTLDFALKGDVPSGKEKRGDQDRLREPESKARLLHPRDLRGRAGAKGHGSKVPSGRARKPKRQLRRGQKR